MKKSLAKQIKEWIDYLELMLPTAKEYDNLPAENSHRIKMELKHLVKRIVTARQRI